MTVYVDPLQPTPKSKQWPYGSACHLYADSDEELHDFARRLGLLPAWFQDHHTLPHYDLTAGKRRHAMKAGAKSATMRETVEVMRERRAGKPKGHP